MHFFILKYCAMLLLLAGNLSCSPALDEDETEVHFGYDTENGQHRIEDIKYQHQEPINEEDVKPVEYRGGYSFVSADGYEYTVLYKANKNGFQPYVTARKIVKSPDAATKPDAVSTTTTAVPKVEDA